MADRPGEGTGRIGRQSSQQDNAVEWLIDPERVLEEHDAAGGAGHTQVEWLIDPERVLEELKSLSLDAAKQVEWLIDPERVLEVWQEEQHV